MDMIRFVNIRSMNSNYQKFAFDLDYIKENSKSIYAKGIYGDIYRIEKRSTKVYFNDRLIANTCEYSIL